LEQLQGTARKRGLFDEFLAKISTAFTALPAGEVDRTLGHGLEQVVKWFGVDRSTFSEISLDGTSITGLQSYAVPGFPPFPAKARLRQFSWFIETLRRGGTVRISRFEDLPVEAREEREYMRRTGLKSNLTIPLFLGHSFIFSIGLGSFKRERAWSDADVRQLRLIGDVFANAVGRQRADEAIWEGENRRRIFLETTISVPWEIDVETGRFTYIGPQAVDLLGYPVEQWFEPHFWERHLHPDDRAAAMEKRRSLSEQTDRYELEYRMLDHHGRVIWLHDLVTVVQSRGRVVMLRGFMMDITPSKQAEDTLRDLSGRLISAQEEERRRIARDLHDDINQGLALAATELEQLSAELGTIAPEQVARAHHTIKRINDIGTSLHALSMTLHPAKLQHLGLSAALRALCRDLSRNKFKVHFNQEGHLPSCRADVALSLYRVAQEALQNVRKHSGAGEARVSLAGKPDRIELVIKDEGKGFDPDSITGKGRLGLVSMRERLLLVGGEFLIQSSPAGTTVQALVPAAAEDSHEETAAAP
jgi:PAS domain S-box-containing protein